MRSQATALLWLIVMPYGMPVGLLAGCPFAWISHQSTMHMVGGLLRCYITHIFFQSPPLEKYILFNCR